ncbi:CPBP family intramembrane glutamic endopeptidase [Tessaracoccus palaemonis]|uniref:CPBP family intramembrane metalloprotease n=1 Tax=Tessaracoccus palaemonis TaxID=2829499 RepID=A0ABX8SIH1_9ACTN|nr:CPBP family intramembrane glutamic endopeptidase [Tessaracoccus palaemonis]QXT63177.1 CPBP family intramembrane metalloprotease [Tessaracoccus palaemonis]
MSTETVTETETAAPRRAASDLPFYNDLPTAISGTKWLVIVAACALAYAQLVLLPLPGSAQAQQWMHAILFPVIPLAALAWAAPQGWTAIFRRVRVRDIGAMIGFGLLCLTASCALAMPLAKVIGASANPSAHILAEASTGQQISFFLATLPQLLGEELITILPMLALMSLLVRWGWSRRASLATAWIGTAVLFGLLHLPTYNWNVLQCLALIGVARLFLTLAFVVTRNLWVSTGAHILNDWIMFSVPILLSAAAITL